MSCQLSLTAHPEQAVVVQAQVHGGAACTGGYNGVQAVKHFPSPNSTIKYRSCGSVHLCKNGWVAQTKT